MPTIHSAATATTSHHALRYSSPEAFLTSVQRLPLLSPQQESELIMRYQQSMDAAAADALILAHMRMVVSLASQFRGYGLPMADLVQEGAIALMKALEHFKVGQGARLCTYAAPWIRAGVNEYILHNWRVVKVATTKAQRKLFFNLRASKTTLDALSPGQIDELAARLDVKAAEVREMEVRMQGGDLPIDAEDDQYSSQHERSHHLACTHYDPTRVLERREAEWLETHGITGALSELDERSRSIIEARWLAGETGKGASLHELGLHFGISPERVRQIEKKALAKMRNHLSTPLQ